MDAEPLFNTMQLLNSLRAHNELKILLTLEAG